MAAKLEVQSQTRIQDKSVQLESWPAQPVKQAPSSLSLAGSAGVGGRPLSLAGLAVGSSPKPKFLQQLETYLAKELRLLGCPPSGPHELRLQAHREVFEYLIEDFKTYKPLLSAVKSEYELFITHLQEKIGSLEPLSGEMEVVREECERRLLAIAQEEKRAETEVERENKRLLTVIDSLRSKEKEYIRQVERLQEEVGQLYQQYRQESDARKLLVADYNDMKQQQTRGDGQKSEVDGGSDEREDPTVLRLKLVRAREDLRLASERITAMLADYSDVVPRREFERLEANHQAMEEELGVVKADHMTLATQHRVLRAQHQGLLAERDRLGSSLAHLRGTATPRPDWSRCEAFVEGWAEFGRGLSSDQLVDLLLARLSGRSLEEVTALTGFQGQGLGEEVPRYLCWEGKLPNQRFSQRQVNSLVAGFWSHTLSSDPHSLVVDECLWQYLLSRNEGDESMAATEAYNLQDAATRLSHEPHISLFCRVLSGELRVEVVQSWLASQTALDEACAQLQENDGVISSESVSEVMRTVFPAKSQAQLAQLMFCAQTNSRDGQSVVNFRKMLTPDGSGRPSELALLLLEQQMEETRELIDQLKTATQDTKEALTVAEVESVITKLDPDCPTPLLHDLLTLLYSDTEEALPITQITTHLTACGLTRHTPTTTEP